ncbi:cytochrome b5 domain-containing protein RLF-like [Bidens hawaiensis]|uniref:cytochrome b5 domain-containing protein RLF-like n=1 Tax=Bidens hawaiensis TaxID=980011 RepID=UPI004048F430
MDETENNNDFAFSQVGHLQPIGIPDASTMSINDDKNNDTNWSDNARANTDSDKQEKVGSLSFKVTDASPKKPSTEHSKLNAGSSKDTKAGAKSPTCRAKVPFEIGYTHMDWLKVTRTHPDLAGIKGQSNTRLISLSEVKQHNTEDSMWTVFKGCVYNITPYMKYHPGGVDMLKKAVGKDCTTLFHKYHAWVNAEFMLEKCVVGILEDSRI